jgi:N-acetylmuramoyl-L-alanine amidase
MLTKKTTSKFSYLQRIIALPVLVILVIGLSLKTKQIIAHDRMTEIQTESTEAFRDNVSKTSFEKEGILPVSLGKKYKVIIDAGHGGEDIGALAADGTTESEIVLRLAKLIKQFDANKNLEIVLTRESDTELELKQRTDFVNEQKADLFVSLHCNKSTGEMYGETGFEIITVKKRNDSGNENASKTFAGFMNYNLSKGSIISRGLSSRQDSIFVLQATNCPGIIIETGFVTSKQDLQILQNEQKLNEISVRILNGILQYLSFTEMRKK